MSRQRQDERGTSRERTAEERERARLEREARRTKQGPPSAVSTPAPAARPEQPPAPEPPLDLDPNVQRIPKSVGRPPAPAGREAGQRPPPAQRAADRTRDRERTASPAPVPAASRKRSLRRIQPEPPAPPAAPAGALDDETERPIGIRRTRRVARPVVTPPGDKDKGPARARRLRTRLVGIVALALLAALVIGAILLLQPFGTVEGVRVKVTIPPGSSAGDVGNRLAGAGVVDSGLLFSNRATRAGKRGSLRAGPHTMRRSMTYGAAIEQLTSAPVSTKPPTIKVVIPEGLARREIVPIARKADLRGSYLRASRRFSGKLDPFTYGAPSGTRSLEGFLFPATYELQVGAKARDLVDRQLQAFKDNVASIDLRRAKRKNLSGYDVLIIASMVEREARLARERPLIAAVIYNRLKDGVPLGIDATTRYALGKWSGELKTSDLEIQSPYNTRKRAGLPPTPIGNPGLASIRAASNPAKVSYRYFVVKPGTCGQHTFSSDDATFQRDSQIYKEARAKAGNRSPTTC
ncbi:MAG TPA: endolytic transglycosylase MltG [Solirubrobacteraceae bacterium]